MAEVLENILVGNIFSTQLIIRMNILGLITFSNIIFVLSILMIVAASIWLFGIYFVAIIAILPVQTIELILYLGLGYSAYSSHVWFGPELGYIWALLFGAGLSATTLLTGVRSKSGNAFLFNFVNMMIHGLIGIHVGSTLICSVSVMFFMSLIGFQFGFGPGVLLDTNHRTLI